MNLTRDEKIRLLKLKQEKIRRNARSDFYSFCQYMDPEFFSEDKPHLKKIADIFQLVFLGILKRVAVSMPPRWGKSYITSLFCLFMLAHNADGSVMRNSYSATLARKFSYDIRAMVRNPKFQELFPEIQLSDDKTAIDGWNLKGAKQVSYFCAGVGGSITGFGCNILAVLDDPVKNIEEALSETVTENKWQWYTSTHKSRLEKGCPEIHIATRWSKDDPIGKLLELDYFDEVINISAVDEFGNSNCEAIKTTEEYKEIKRVTDDFIWMAEYMQQPIDVEGALFTDLNRFKLSELNVKPDACMVVNDVADKGDDFLSSAKGYIYGKKVYIVDVIFTQDDVRITAPLVAAQIISNQVKGNSIIKPVDRAVFESNSMGHTFKVMVEGMVLGLSSASIEDRPTTGHKETRILMKSGKIRDNFYFLDESEYETGSHYDKFMKNLTRYVKGGKNKHDDAPDDMAIFDEVLNENDYNWS